MLSKQAQKICFFSAVLISVASALLLCTFSSLYANINQDEGWYLYAAKSVAAGLHPYKDFFYTQAPVMPWFYSCFEWLWGDYGVFGGRVFTAVLGFISSICVAAMAFRAAPKQRSNEAGVIAFALVACNLYHIYFTTIPKTYALAALFLYSGYLLLSFCFCRENKSAARSLHMWALPAGLLIALAAGTRLSLVTVLPVTTLALMFYYKKCGSTFFWFALGGLIGLLLIFAPVFLYSKDEFIFSQSFHVSRSGYDLFMIAGSLSRLIRAYLTQFALFSMLVLVYLFLKVKVNISDEESSSCSVDHNSIWPLIWFSAFLAVFFVHILSPHPYDDYHVPVMGLFSAALAVWVVNLFNKKRQLSLMALVVVITINLCSFSSPLIQEWFTEGQDRFWVLKKSQSDINELKSAAADITALLDGEKMLLTQDTYLAVEADLKVPRGLEMGPFGYFPDLSDEAADKYHVFNRAGMHKLLSRAPCEVAAFSGYGLAIRAPVMDHVPYKEYQIFMRELSTNYDFVQEIPDFAQNDTLLQILKRRKNLAE